MKYEENVWYGWNGGECPVHPETVVDYVWVDHIFGTPCIIRSLASEAKWRCGISDIIAFRVIKEHKEPREFWIYISGEYKEVFYDKDFALMQQDEFGGEIIHVREVIE